MASAAVSSSSSGRVYAYLLRRRGETDNATARATKCLQKFVEADPALAGRPFQFVCDAYNATGAQPELDRLLARLAKHDVLLCENITCASRNPAVLKEVRSTLLGVGAYFVTVEEGQLHVDTRQGEEQWTNFNEALKVVATMHSLQQGHIQGVGLEAAEEADDSGADLDEHHKNANEGNDE